MFEKYFKFLVVFGIFAYFVYYNWSNQSAMNVGDAPSILDALSFESIKDAKKESIILILSLALYIGMASYNNYLDRLEAEAEQT